MTTHVQTAPVSQLQNSAQDIRSFVEAKQPKSDIQFAAVVAYFHQFVAREGERKEAIDKEVLKDAFRKARRKIPKDCGFTLVNALNAGLLDRKDGKFSVNPVGENLVAMTLPGDAASPSVSKGRKKSRKPAQRTGAKNRSK